MNRTVIGVVVGLLGSGPASVLAAASYLYVVLDAPVGLAISDGIAIAVTMIPFVCAVGALAGAMAALLSGRASSIQGLGVPGVAAAGGASFGMWVAHGSPHVSRPFAVMAGIFGWSLVGLLITLATWLARRITRSLHRTRSASPSS